MKRTDMKAGQDYLVSSSPDWENGQRVDRYRVLSTDVWKDRVKYRYGNKPATDVVVNGLTVTTFATNDGTGRGGPGVLAMRVERDGSLRLLESGKPAAVVIPAQQVRAPWDEGAETIRANNAARDAAAAAKRERQAQEDNRLAGIFDALEQALGRPVGLGYASLAWSGRDASRVVIGTADLEALADLLKR